MQREGLADKYRVERLGDDDGNHDECRYFVLDPQHDPAAREAIRIYALNAQCTNPQLAMDLGDWLGRIEGYRDMGLALPAAALESVLDDHSYNYPDSFCACGVDVDGGTNYHAHLAAAILASPFMAELMADAKMERRAQMKACCASHHFVGCADGGPGCCRDCPTNPTRTQDA